MSDQHNEPGELTERFAAFAKSTDQPPSRTLPYALIAVCGALLVVLVVTIIVLVN
jgi:hypothetical protein